MNEIPTQKPPSDPGVGVDYGTSNSVAAIYDGSRVTVLNLEIDNPVMPSATYVDRNYKIETGKQAINEYVQSNVGRTVELSAELLGEGRSTTGQIGDHGLPEAASTDRIYGQSFIDGGQPGRLFLGIKRLLGTTDNQRIMVFQRAFRLVALITPQLIRMHKSIIQAMGNTSPAPASADHVCIGHPVNFEGKAPDRNRTALNFLSEAYGYAEFSQQSFYPEPIAAALSYIHSFPSVSEQTLLAVDFGGGTLDLCVISRKDTEFKLIATHGIGLGGDHIDQLLFRRLLFPLLGKGERWRRAGEDREIETLFPFEEYEELLLNWAISYMLNQNQYTYPLMQRIQVGDTAAVKFQRLYDLIKNNYSHLVFQSLRQLKVQLSENDSAVLDIPELDIELTVSRSEFEAIIDGLLDDFATAVSDVLQTAGLQSSEIGLVIRTGGSSLIPAVRRILDARFPGKVVEHDPFTSVAAGLAIAEYYGFGTSLNE